MPAGVQRHIAAQARKPAPGNRQAALVNLVVRDADLLE
jgi:hypothetical protein